MTTDDFASLSVDRRLAEISDMALVEVNPAHRPDEVRFWRARIAWPSDLPRDHQVLAFTHATRHTSQEAVQTCAERIRERCLHPENWGLTTLELGRLLLYWEFRESRLAKQKDPAGDVQLAEVREMFDKLVCILETAPRMRAELDEFYPDLVTRVRDLAQRLQYVYISP